MSDDLKQPNKPGGDIDSDGNARAPGERRAVQNQGSVTPDDYPPGSNGKPEAPPKNARP